MRPQGKATFKESLFNITINVALKECGGDHGWSLPHGLRGRHVCNRYDQSDHSSLLVTALLVTSRLIPLTASATPSGTFPSLCGAHLLFFFFFFFFFFFHHDQHHHHHHHHDLLLLQLILLLHLFIIIFFVFCAATIAVAMAVAIAE